MIRAIEEAGNSEREITVISKSKYLSDALNREWPVKWEQEGWLRTPGEGVTTERSKEVTVRAMNLDGRRLKIHAHDLLA